MDMIVSKLTKENGVLYKDSMYVGEGPFDEPCPNVGEPDYDDRARLHCQRFIEQIRRVYGTEPRGARLRIKSNPHDFGSYYSVEVEYYCDPSSDDATSSESYAYRVEADWAKGLQVWDEEAKETMMAREVRV